MTQVLARLAKLDACAASDALDSIGQPGAITTLQRLSVRQRVVGRVQTVQLVPAGTTESKRHLCTAAVDASDDETVLVVSNDGRTDAASWGGVLSTGAVARGVRGVIVNGAARDVDEAIEAQLPVWAKAATPVTARGRYVESEWAVPVMVDGVDVHPGDFVVADGSGVVFIPAARIDEVLDAATRIVAKEAEMANRAAAGVPMTEVMGASYESLLSGADAKENTSE